MRCGGRSWRSTAVAAAASGGATTAPSAIAGAHGIAGISARATHGDRDGRQADREHDQAGDRRPVVPEISRRRVVRRIEQHRRDEQRQRELGSDGERGRAGNEREERAAERQEHRIGRADAACRRRQDHGREHQADECFEFPHLSMVTQDVEIAPRRSLARPGFVYHVGAEG